MSQAVFLAQANDPLLTGAPSNFKVHALRRTPDGNKTLRRISPRRRRTRPAGNAGSWALLAVDMVTPYIDNQPLLVANTPETREYRMSFWDSGEANGDWTAVVKVTVGA